MYADGLTARQIAAKVSIPFRTIIRYLNRAGVPMRKPGLPAIAILADREWLAMEYVDKRRSSSEIAAEIGCSKRSVILWLNRHHVIVRPSGSAKGHKRSTDESRQKQSAARRGKFIGSKNPNWRGGIQLKHPERNRYRAKMWVKAVKDRDGWTCVECKSPNRLHAHHIIRWKDRPELRYEISNGVTLCHDCHLLAHGWTNFRWSRQADKPTSAPVSD